MTVFKTLSRLLDKGARRLSDIDFALRLREARRTYRRSSFRITGPGEYRRRGDGKTVLVIANDEGWFDRLPWIVQRGGRHAYTVDDKGFVSPARPFPAPDDIVQRASD